MPEMASTVADPMTAMADPMTAAAAHVNADMDAHMNAMAAVATMTAVTTVAFGLCRRIRHRY